MTFFLLFMGIHIVSSLNEPEYYSAYSYTENGITVQEDESKNPNYLSGTKRKVYEFLNDFTPGGQLFQIGQRLFRLHGLHRSQNCIHGDNGNDNDKTFQVSGKR